LPASNVGDWSEVLAADSVRTIRDVLEDSATI